MDIPIFVWVAIAVSALLGIIFTHLRHNIIESIHDSRADFKQIEECLRRRLAPDSDVAIPINGEWVMNPHLHFIDEMIFEETRRIKAERASRCG